jgi:hypothetical protein
MYYEKELFRTAPVSKRVSAPSDGGATLPGIAIKEI